MKFENFSIFTGAIP